jgi:hypothetical protein
MLLATCFLCHNFGTPFADIENQNNDKKNVTTQVDRLKVEGF